jgi:hypothetical protein
MRNFIAPVLIGLFVVGCSSRPLPEDFSGVSTLAITNRIRCEAREAIVKISLDYLERKGASEASRKFAAQVRNDSQKLRNFSFSELDDAARKQARKYDGAAIAYDFTFNLKTTFGGGVGLDFIRPLAGGALNFGGGVGVSADRENVRNFRLTDTFIGLLRDLDPESCKESEDIRALAYPLTGSIGLAEIVSTFVGLNEGDRLQAKEGGVPTISDTVRFVTTLNASISPGLELTPAGRRWQLTNANAGETGVSFTRRDEHQVAIVISLPPETDSDPKAEKPPAAPREKIRAARRTPAENEAIKELDRQQLRRTEDNTRRINRALGLPAN